MLLPCNACGLVLGSFFCHDDISTVTKTALQQSSLPPVLVGNMQSRAFFIRLGPWTLQISSRSGRVTQVESVRSSVSCLQSATAQPSRGQRCSERPTVEEFRDISKLWATVDEHWGLHCVRHGVSSTAAFKMLRACQIQK